MNEMEIMEIGRQALIVLIKVSLPVMLVALVVGLIISLFQALTQIQEMTLSFVPKMIAIFLSLMLLLPWMTTTLGDFTQELSDRIVDIEK